MDIAVMKICFLRHGEADWPDWNKPDDERPLTDRGRREMKRVAKFLDRLEFSVDAIPTRPLTRASQTCEPVPQSLGIGMQIEPKLAHGFSLERHRQVVRKVEGESVMVVGQEPEFSAVIEDLTDGDIKISK